MSKPAEQEQLRFTCVPVDDTGTAHPERARDRMLITSHFAACTSAPSTDCTMDELGKASADCGAGHQIRNCKMTCVTAQGASYCGLPRPDTSVDLCTQPFDERGMRYNNMVDYCTRIHRRTGWGNCSVQGFKPSTGMQPQWTSSDRVTALVPGNTTADMIRTFKSNADRIFGARNHAVASIVLDPAFSCPVQPGQSHAPNLRQLATSPGDVFPLCQDYAPALQRIANFADYLVQTDFPLNLDAFEAVDSVVVTNNAGVQRTLRPTDYRYDRPAKILRINAGVLGGQDASLAVNVARHCEPIP